MGFGVLGMDGGGGQAADVFAFWEKAESTGSTPREIRRGANESDWCSEELEPLRLLRISWSWLRVGVEESGTVDGGKDLTTSHLVDLMGYVGHREYHAIPKDVQPPVVNDP